MKQQVVFRHSFSKEVKIRNIYETADKLIIVLNITAQERNSSLEKAIFLTVNTHKEDELPVEQYYINESGQEVDFVQEDHLISHIGEIESMGGVNVLKIYNQPRGSHRSIFTPEAFLVDDYMRTCQP